MKTERGVIMTTHEVEELLSITKQSLIYYEKEGLITPKRNHNHYRNYSQEDIDILKMILLLRSMEISIDDIKLIMNNELSIRNALETKREYIEKSKIKLESIDQKIKDYVKRRKVKVSFNHKKLERWKDYDTLYFNEDNISFNEITIELETIISIDISMYSSMSKGRAGVGGYGLGAVYFQYYIDLDIHTSRDTYSFSILNNKMVNDMFDYMLENQLKINDPLQLIQLYHEKKDEAELNKYINVRFKEWAKEYHLDNPRDDFSYYSMYLKQDNDKKKDFFGLSVLKKMFQ